MIDKGSLSEQRSVAYDLIQELRDLGLKSLFGVSGGRILPVFQACLDNDGPRLYATRNEQGAAYMADAFWRAGGGLAGCLSTSGPGATNLLTGVAGAFADSIPMIVLTGQAATTELGRGGIQEGSGMLRSPDVCGMYRNCTKWSYRLRHHDNPKEVARAAVSCALTARPGPVHLDLPFDILASPLGANAGRQDNEFVKPGCPSEQSSKPGNVPELDATTLEAICRLIDCASYPALILGAGAVRDQNVGLVKALAARAGIAVATSFGGRGLIDERSEFALGQMGCYGQDTANEYLIARADLIVALGTSFQYLTSMGWNPRLREKTLVHIDTDARELGKTFCPVIGAVGDATRVLVSIAERCTNGERAAAVKTSISELRESMGYYPSRRLAQAGESRPGYVGPTDAYRCLDSVRQDQDCVLLDSGENAYWGMFACTASRPRQLFTQSFFGAMGYGVAGAIGAAAAIVPTDGRVWACCGDGGLLMNATELTVAAHHGFKVTWVVLDNGCYGTQRHWQRDLCGGRYIGTEMPRVDICKLAEAMGVSATAVSTVGGLRSALEESRSLSTPNLIAVQIDPEVKPAQAKWSNLVK